MSQSQLLQLPLAKFQNFQANYTNFFGGIYTKNIVKHNN